jgi:hypothetical protein
MLGCSFSQVDDPELFGGSDNNGYGLKVFAFLRLTTERNPIVRRQVPFCHFRESARQAPRRRGP